MYAIPPAEAVTLGHIKAEIVHVGVGIVGI